jgi:DNA-binding HxlR family transcriptional regulator
MEDERQAENDRQRAEVFDALGHPTRILILKALSEGALGFADLKKKTSIESSGHLQHHLTKLDGLIKTDGYGKYFLSEQGKDSLLTVQAVENVSLKTNSPEKIRWYRFNRKMILKSFSLLLRALLVASSATALFEYNQTTSLQKEFNQVNGKDAAAYYSKFGLTPTTETNSSFRPPISMYQALIIGLEADGWNKTALQGMTVYINLTPWTIVTNTTAYNSSLKLPITINLNAPLMTSIPESYSHVIGNGVIYIYVWQIDIQKPGVLSMPPVDFILIDAATGQIVQNPPLY